MNRLPSSAALALITAILAGCSSASATDPSPAPPAADALQSCLSKCAADGIHSARSVCGTDKVTYPSCDWECSNVPSGVGVVPGACEPNGTPPVDGPPRPADGVTTCGWQKVDGAWIASPCAATLTPPAREVPAPVAQHPETTEGPLPAEVDHRARFGLVRNQGKAPSCTAFSTTAALESAIRANVGEKTVLSEMHLWSRYAEGYVDVSTTAVLTGGTATNAAAVAAGMPYDENLALAWSEHDAYPDQRVVDKLNAAARFKVTGVDVLLNELGTDGVVERIQRALAAGEDVNVSLIQSSEWSLPNDDGTIPEEEFGERTGHAVLFVGYKTINGRPYFLLRNSWGRRWGHQGYAYLSFDAAKKNVMWASVTQIARRDLAEPKACAPTHGHDLDNVCRVRCADGSLAGADGLCERPLPICASGQLHDASGVCVDACGKGTKSGAGWSVVCDDATCKFTVDAGFTGCADDGKGTPCTKVCPAPQCDLAVMKDELGRARLACWGRDL